jgi:hypothetical protein
MWQSLFYFFLIIVTSAASELTREEYRVQKAHDLLMRSFQSEESRIARDSLQLASSDLSESQIRKETLALQRIQDADLNVFAPRSLKVIRDMAFEERNNPIGKDARVALMQSQLEKAWHNAIKETDRQLVRRMDVAVPAGNVVHGGLSGMFRGGESSSSRAASRIRAQMRVEKVVSHHLPDITEDGLPLRSFEDRHEGGQDLAGPIQAESDLVRFLRDERTLIAIKLGLKFIYKVCKIAIPFLPPDIFF